ncbi:Type 1 glutamine amidotransferase-like domain-containing protein [Prevotella histicola]|uniref:Type 1 glutamine amidotransferase-like domain-containing protein n=1 Tax=Prevotella histicola TaxID=470565 RepID=UPI0028E4B736|nr:Type 1 glutamine amidotransferase-like domain-containing protein [Prevotella histicola]
MKRLFLTSSFSLVAKLFEDFAGEPVKGKKLAFIPTASLVEKVRFYVDDDRKAFEKLGLIIEELEVSTATTEEIATALERNDYIFISGGNTFYLMQELKKKGADKLLIEQINNGKLYIGTSAGSVIASPTVEFVSDIDETKKAPELTDYSGLHLIDFYFLPHYLNLAVSTCKCTARKVKEYFRKNTQKGYENLIFLSGDGLFFQQLC